VEGEDVVRVLVEVQRRKIRTRAGGFLRCRGAWVLVVGS